MKKIILPLIAIFMMVSLVGCGSKTKAENSVKDFFNSYEKMDLKKADEYVEDGGLLKKSILKFENYNQNRQEALKYWSSKISYKILSSKKDGKEVDVETEVTALNGTYIYNNYMQNVQSLNFNENTLNGNGLNGDDVGNNFDKAFISALENQGTPMSTNKVVVKVKNEDGKWKIQNDKEVLQAILGGLNPEQILD